VKRKLKQLVSVRGRTLIVTDAGAKPFAGDPVALSAKAIETIEETGEMKIMHGVLTGFDTKSVGDYIEIASLPANARVVRYVFGLQGGAIDMNAFVGNTVDDGAYVSGLSPFAFFTVTDPVSVMCWRKEVVATTMRFKIDTKSSVPAGSVIEYWIEYIQE
jgi:hypothetical protein